MNEPTETLKMNTIREAYNEFLTHNENCVPVLANEHNMPQYHVWKVTHNVDQITYDWLGKPTGFTTTANSFYVWIGPKGAIYFTVSPYMAGNRARSTVKTERTAALLSSMWRYRLYCEGQNV